MENIPRFSRVVISGRIHFFYRLQLNREQTEWDYNMSRGKERSCLPVVNEWLERAEQYCIKSEDDTEKQLFLKIQQKPCF